MADVMPDYMVQQQKFRSLLAQHHATIEKQKLEVMEMDSRRKRVLVNIGALEKAIVETEGKLKHMERDHGKLRDKDFMREV